MIAEAKDNANNQITENKTQAINNINEAKTSKLKMKLVERKNRSLSKH
ncbi:hypothetical protein [Helicobacter pylori]